MFTCTSFLNFVSIKFWSWKGKLKVLLAVEEVCIVAEYDFAWCLVYLLVCLTYKVRQSFGLINLSNIPKKLQTSEVWIIAGVRQSITTEAPPPLFFFCTISLLWVWMSDAVVKCWLRHGSSIHFHSFDLVQTRGSFISHHC